MNVNDKNNAWSLLNQSYTQKQSTNSSNIGYSKDSNSLFGTQNTQGVEGISSLFDLGTQPTSTTTEIHDSFEISSELTNLQDFAKNFSENFAKNSESLGNLGNAMQQSGILSAEEKMGFDVLYKFNPSLDSTQTQNLLQNTNLSKENLNLLSQVDRKIGAVRYFGGF